MENENQDKNGYGERLEGEGAKAFMFFLEYCDMGFSRSLVGLAQMVVEGQSASLSVIQKWCRKFNWKERSRVYDSVVAAHRFQAKVKARNKSRKPRGPWKQLRAKYQQTGCIPSPNPNETE